MSENEDVKPSEHVVKSPTTVQIKDEDKHQSKEIARYENNASISTLNLFDEKQLASAEAFLTKVMRSKKGGIESVADGLAVLMRANDLGLPFSTCIEHIHVINGKTGIDIHIVKALLSRAGCTWRLVKDYQPLYEYTDGINVYIDGSFPEHVVRVKSEIEAREKAKIEEEIGGDKLYAYPVKFYKDLEGYVYRDYQINDKFGIGVNMRQLEGITKQGKKAIHRIPNVPVDYVTQYEITRKLHGKEINAVGRFSYSDAVKAEMFEKDTYKKYPKVLIGHRAFTYAAREIASDILFGVMETTELKIVSNVNLSNKDFDNSVEDAELVEL